MGGIFVVDLNAEKFCSGDAVSIFLPEFDCHISAEVRRIKLWGILRHSPGIGLSFGALDETLVSVISGITRTCKEFDRDRLTP